ncbi:hypothetical protein KP509_02G025300 [Ceratopteris richardii]|uniref:Thioredoxin domain-containing protein n=1 Tax=Ceratopteris richardii TaxID=49495 RepID=A0A8T2V7Z6_CERRI|nr:hypothetical protein KP509_02G025300 [Ceratopteris richardii]
MAASSTPFQLHASSSLPYRACMLLSSQGQPCPQSLPYSSQFTRPCLAVFDAPLDRIARDSFSCASSSGSFAVDPITGQHEPKLSHSKVSAVLFDMDGVICNSEERSRCAAVELFSEIGVHVTAEDFLPFTGTGESNFLGAVAKAYGVKDFDISSAKSRFFQIYLEKYAKPNSGLEFPGAHELIMQCKAAGLKVALVSSADRLKVDVNLAAAGLPSSIFNAIISADAFTNLKPAPDIFLAASKALNVPAKECVVVEDAVAGLQAARAAGMRSIAVTTTLNSETLLKESPLLIRTDVGDITLDDILKLQEPDDVCTYVKGEISSVSPGRNSRNDGGQVLLPAGLSVTRREALRYGSLTIAVLSSYVAVTHWKAMSYTSPRALLNAALDLFQPSIAIGAVDSDRVARFLSYIEDVEARGGGQQVPEFQPQLEWLNTTPLKFQKDLAGKVVVLDFWTYCCINCMHILPDLEYLERKYKGKPVTVIGVHSAKFDNEKDLSAIRNAVLRYNVTHPVVNDGDMVLWRKLGINSWPTLVVVSPQGKTLAVLSGEGHRKDLDEFVNASLQYYGNKNLLSDRPLPETLEKDKDVRLVSSPLKFPGKITTDLANGRLFISDSNHHRIVITDLEGNFIQQVGGMNGEGLQDGSFEEASFNRPQGVAYNPNKNVLYVADTENHALREVDFANEVVRTLAGNGIKGSDYKGGKQGTLQVLNSPWDVCCDSASGIVYIAMAGQHQIWQHIISSGVTGVFSGDGFERNLNGKRAQDTSFAQPSGLAFTPDMKGLFVADSESSSVRRVDLVTGGSNLLAGGDPLFADNLFQFGDKDGTGTAAQFQHPLGVLYNADGLVYVADSYNHKIKIMDPNSRNVKTIAGIGKAGFKDGKASECQLSEPAGLAMGLDGKVYIADTNNCVIRVLDTQGGTGPTISTLELKGVQPPEPKTSGKPRRLRRRSSGDVELVKTDPIKATEGNIKIRIGLPAGFHFTKEVASKFEADDVPDEKLVFQPASGSLDANGEAVLTFSRPKDVMGTVQINCKVYYCEEDQVCLYKALAFQIPFDEAASSSRFELPLTYDLQPPVRKQMLIQ